MGFLRGYSRALSLDIGNFDDVFHSLSQMKRLICLLLSC